jgi:hypothetical protein
MVVRIRYYITGDTIPSTKLLVVLQEKVKMLANVMT